MDKTNTNTNPALAGQKNKPLWWHSLEPSILNPGVIVEGKVSERTKRSLYVDLGRYGSGVVWGLEFLVASGAISDLNIGDTIKTKVLSSENDRGLVELSLREVNREIGWQWIKGALNKNESVLGKVLSANRGGLIVSVNNFQGFLPTSQMSEEHFPKVEDGNKEKILEALEKLVGQEIKVRILEFNNRDNKMILSEKNLDDKSSGELLEKYKVGTTIEVTVNKLTNFGAYATMESDPQTKCFIQLADIDWKLIEKPEEIIKEGEKHQAQIIGARDGELKLSLKALKKDPWLEKTEAYKEGQSIQGEVYKFMPFGALIKLDAEIYGFIHSSEFGGLDKMKEALELKKIYEFTIETIKIKEKRINLKLSPAK